MVAARLGPRGDGRAPGVIAATAGLFLAFAMLLLAGGPLMSQQAAEGGGSPEVLPGEVNAVRQAPVCDPAELEQAAGMHRTGVVPFTVLAAGPFADRRETGVEVIASQGEWIRLVDRGFLDESLADPDFAQGSVIVVYGGSRPTAGYEVTVEGVRRRSENVLLLQARVEGPPPGAIAATVVTSPYVVIEVAISPGEFQDVNLELRPPNN